MRTIMSQWVTKILNREWTRINANGGTLSPGTADRLIGRFFVRAFFSLRSLRSLRLIPSGSLNYRTPFIVFFDRMNRIYGM